MSPKMTITPPPTATTSTTTIMILTSLLLALIISSQHFVGAQLDHLTITQDQPPQPIAQQSPPQQSQPSTRQPQQEILVQPNSPVRIECKLPKVVASGSRKFYWNFQRSSLQDNKPDLLCFQTQCIDEAAYGIQLEVDQSLGVYDLLINNATYELNDGIYYCDYKDTSPDSRATINREFRLTVLIPPQPPTISANSQAPAREGQEYQLSCVSPGGNPEPNITWFRNDQQLVPGSGVRIEQSRQNGSTTSTLTWIPTIDDHQAVYKCSVSNKAMSGLAPFERELSLPVEYAPRITVGPFNPLRVLQGDKATLSCQVDANPPVKGIRWLVDGHVISNQFNHTLHDVKISEAAVYSCQADNGIVPTLLGPNALQPTHTGQMGAGAGSSFFSFLGLTSSNPGHAHQDGPIKSSVEARLQLEVLYPPRVQVRQSRTMPLSEGDHLSLNCSVESWPPAYEFIWTKQEDQTTFRRVSSSSSPVLEFHSISASDMGNYTCTALNRLEPSGILQPVDRQASGSSMVLVRHKPGFAEIIVGQNGETELGNKTQIQCRAKPPGYPEPQYKFWRYQGASASKYHLNKQTHGPVYTIFSAKPEDEAKYGCLAFNELGVSNEADGDLIVNEVPIIISDSARREEDARPQGDYPYSITVRASGKPEPKVAWFHRSPVDGRRIALNSPEMALRFRIETLTKPEQHQTRSRYTVVSTLTFRNPLEIDDRGLYTVEFSNGLSRSATEDFQLHIYHSPIPAPRNQPVVMRKDAQGNTLEPRLKAGFNLGETANITCRVSAYPQPQFVWYSGEGGKSLENNPRYRSTARNTIDDIWESTVTFTMASEADYGEYMCVTANHDTQTNAISENVRIFTNLSRKSLPDAPSQLEQIDATQDSVTLQWLPGFDGGFTQNQFIVQYAPDDGSGAPLSRRFVLDYSSLASQPNSLADQMETVAQQDQQQYPKLYDCLSMNPCTINHLLPRQAYIMRLRARNEMGFSEFSEEIRVLTRANMSQIPKILDASFDTSRNILHFRIEPNPDYLLNNLNAKIEVRPGERAGVMSNSVVDQQQQVANEMGHQQQADIVGPEWRLHSTVPIRQERGEAYLNMQPASEQLRITLCSRSNESLCGPEYVVSMRNAASSFLQDQRGVSLSILTSTVILIVVLGALATTLHSCCLSRKAKKAAALDRADGLNGLSHTANGADKPLGGHTNGGLVTGSHKGSHGSTTSTNNSSVANGQLQSIDSIHGHLNAGSASDHSSDHSRQAKLDSMLPPNYNHYADRASLMLEQQQQQQQQGYLQDKLSSPFGLPSSALMSSLTAASQQQPSPMMNGSLNHFAYGQHGQMSSLDHQQQAASMLDGTNGISLNSVLGSDPIAQQTDGQPQSMWPQHQTLDDYSYNTLTSYNQSQPQDQMIDPTYGTTTGGLIMAQQPASYDNNANQFCQSYLGAAYQQQQQQQQDSSQYQQEIVAAQQQMYGTLTRNGYNTSANGTNADSSTINQQQQQPGAGQDHLQQQQSNEQYMTTNGLLQPPPPPVESDYGTTGGRSGRLIREIIV